MENKPYISRKEQAQMTKKKIFDVTMVMLRKKNYNKITIREICQSAQISVGTFYLYFSSKDEILLENFRNIDARLLPLEKGNYLSAPQRICQYFYNYLKEIANMFDKELMREICRINLFSGKNEFLKENLRLYTFILECIQEEADHLQLTTDLSVTEICIQIHLFVQSYIYQWVIDNDLSADYLTVTAIENLQKYLSLFFQEN